MDDRSEVLSAPVVASSSADEKEELEVGIPPNGGDRDTKVASWIANVPNSVSEYPISEDESTEQENVSESDIDEPKSNKESHSGKAAPAECNEVRERPPTSDISCQSDPQNTNDSDELKTLADLSIFLNGAFEQDDFTNCVFKTSDAALYCHKAIIGSQCAALTEALKADTGDIYVLLVPNEHSADVRLFLEAVYDRKVLGLQKENARKLAMICRLAQTYGVENIRAYCEVTLSEAEVDEETLSDMVIVAFNGQNDRLMTRCIDVAKRLPESYWKQEHVEKFTAEHPKALLALVAGIGAAATQI